MCTLLDNRPTRFALVPPYFRFDLCIGAGILGDGHHDRFSCRLDDVFHVLNDLEVSKHITDGSYSTALLKEVSKVDGILHWRSCDRLLNEESCFGEVFEDLDFKICSWTAMMEPRPK